MTIDFHPSSNDLEDEKKFSVKQYSVTLPPIDETTYKSHTELLDDLLMQRMRQDFQIVPRNIIQQNPRRDVTDNELEATLSMGHKIQRLSHNSSTDSVDVVQYYARFAEDEVPQTYHYFLWSALQQDYGSVCQPFTKYTAPYKWNELVSELACCCSVIVFYSCSWFPIIKSNSRTCLLVVMPSRPYSKA